MNRFRRLFRSDASRNRLHVPPGIRQAQPFLKNILFPAIRTMAPTLFALSFAGVAHAQGTMDFSGTTSLMTTFKTATLQEIDRGLRESGCEVTAVAPTRGAVEELQKVGFREAMTVSRLLQDETAQSALRGRVLVPDEAGMISGRQMNSILQFAESKMARIVFSGDTRQIQSIEASDALRILERESQMKSVALTGVQRQTHAQYRDAIQTLRQTPEQGFEKLERLGAVREVPFTERARAVADLYREMTVDSSRRILVVAPTHEEIDRVTRAKRHDGSIRPAAMDGSAET